MDRLALNSDMPASASQLLGLKACASMPRPRLPKLVCREYNTTFFDPFPFQTYSGCKFFVNLRRTGHVVAAYDCVGLRGE